MKWGFVVQATATTRVIQKTTIKTQYIYIYIYMAVSHFFNYQVTASTQILTKKSSSLKKYRQIWQNFVEFNEMFIKFNEFRQIWWIFVKFDECSKKLTNFRQIWWNFTKFDEFSSNLMIFSSNLMIFQQIWRNFIKFDEM